MTSFRTSRRAALAAGLSALLGSTAHADRAVNAAAESPDIKLTATRLTAARLHVKRSARPAAADSMGRTPSSTYDAPAPANLRIGKATGSVNSANDRMGGALLAVAGAQRSQD